MPQITTIVANAVGLHARPAALFVQIAKRFSSTITVHVGERKANAKSIVQVLTLGAKQGAELVIHAEGDDADEALHTLQELVAHEFHEVAS